MSRNDSLESANVAVEPCNRDTTTSSSSPLLVTKRQQQLREKSVDISNQLEAIRQLENPSESDVLKKNNLEAELEQVAEELLQLEVNDDDEEEEPIPSNTKQIDSEKSCVSDTHESNSILKKAEVGVHKLIQSVGRKSLDKTNSEEDDSDNERNKLFCDKLNNKYHTKLQHSESEVRNAVEQAKRRLSRRGEKLGQLGKNAEEMQIQAKAFMEAATELNRRQQQRNWF